MMDVVVMFTNGEVCHFNSIVKMNDEGHFTGLVQENGHMTAINTDNINFITVIERDVKNNDKN